MSIAIPRANHTANRIHVSMDRLRVRYRHASAEMTGSTGENGTRNGRSMSGRVCRRIGTVTDTSRAHAQTLLDHARQHDVEDEGGGPSPRKGVASAREPA